MAIDLRTLTAISSWSPNSKHVDQGIVEGVSTGSGDILMAVGPSRLEDVTDQQASTLNQIAGSLIGRTTANVVTLGAVGSATITQNRPTKIVYEIGSKLHYNIPTNVSGSIALSRVFLNDKSLMKALYSFLDTDDLKAQLAKDNLPGQIDSPVWINMASTLFDRPIGIMVWMKDNQEKNVASYYFENCNVQGHTFSLYATGTAFTESTQVVFDRARPVEITALGTVSSV